MKRKGAFDYILLETTGLADPGEHSSFSLGMGHVLISIGSLRPDRWDVLA